MYDFIEKYNANLFSLILSSEGHLACYKVKCHTSCAAVKQLNKWLENVQTDYQNI